MEILTSYKPPVQLDLEELNQENKVLDKNVGPTTPVDEEKSE